MIAVLPSHVLQRVGRRLREAQELGSYQLVELLGTGGMGQVWRAEHNLLARDAAIKLVRPEVLGARNDCRGEAGPSPVRTRSTGNGATQLAAYDSAVRLRDDAGRHVLLRDGAAGRPRSRIARPRVRAGAGQSRHFPCCGRSATRWPMRTRAGSCIGTSSRRTSTSAAWDSNMISSRCWTSGS